ncbi:Gta1p NDAI_0G00270 [Naumovozyma dairenensis CBS 421]|uniref:Fibronectin type-III domain-containing protein n=1 Tax=Naumovozyma dairenensis (strain ATCC 10597 / BCRC 20456 / CBS 421 / NBRC 0211 / NRRL Y-12639) TaxID=1071378 RepID=G0WDE2_NAUDC|nr:hypothetical protein NDAI_0G00270 [Naumovozyma dairenensis CBS 421]CCD25803.2 hypothetical protein NDAI_0G00270 [Naumovozyma dairenensis CBS 421]
MLVYTLFTAMALLWLSYRLLKFLSIPVFNIVSTLKIKTPPATKVSIDKISTNSITIHWENEPLKQSPNANPISHYLLYLNNSQIAIFPNNSNSLYTCCSITNLLPEKQYQLDFITINKMGFINKLPSIFCMTKKASPSSSGSASASTSSSATKYSGNNTNIPSISASTSNLMDNPDMNSLSMHDNMQPIDSNNPSSSDANSNPNTNSDTSDHKKNDMIKTRKWRRNTLNTAIPPYPNNASNNNGNFQSALQNANFVISSHGSSVSLSKLNVPSNANSTSSPLVNSTLNTTTSSATNLPSYTSLTSLQDLESYSIDDLKKILICSQEDLHDVLNQKQSILQDFQETDLELKLELDNLKLHWNHEIDLRKSLKSNIKSLENSKLLSDLKIDKLNKKIAKLNDKILKMQKEMNLWSVNEFHDFNKENLNEKYSKLMDHANENIKNLNNQILILQNQINLQDDSNKKLNVLKKNKQNNSSSWVSISEETNGINNDDISNNADIINDVSISTEQSQKSSPSPSSSGPITTSADIVALNSLLKKINDQTLERSGLLTNYGEELLSKFSANNNSMLVQLIRDQLKIDQELDSKAKIRRSRMTKRIEYLENNFNDISINNRNLMATLIAQPYNNNPPATVNTSQSRDHYPPPTNLLSSEDQINTNNINGSPILNTTDLNLNMLPNNQQMPLISNQLFDPAQMQSPNQGTNLIPMVSTNSSLLPSNHSINNADIILNPQNSFSHGVPTTVITNTTVTNPDFQWSIANQQQQQQQQQPPQQSPLVLSSPSQEHQVLQREQSAGNDLDQAFAYDNANHLISGLQDIIYDETDYPDSISNYSKGFTTDQLDNYWANQNTLSSPPSIPPTNITSSPFINNQVSSSLRNISMGGDIGTNQSQSLLANISGNHLNMMSSRNSEMKVLSNTLSPQNSNSQQMGHHDRSVSHVHNLITNIDGNSSTISNATNNTNTPHQRHEATFTSPSFNQIWHTMSPVPSTPSNMMDGLTAPSPTDQVESTNKGKVHDSKKAKPMSASASASASKASHIRNQSSNSITSWGTKLGLTHKSTHSSTSTYQNNNNTNENVNVALDTGGSNSTFSSSASSLNKNKDIIEDKKDKSREKAKDKEPGAGSSSTRKMSKLLSRTTMNSLFKLPNQHDTQS